MGSHSLFFFEIHILLFERVLVYMNPLVYTKVGSWCVRKNVLVIKKQNVNKKLSFENHPEKFDPLEVVHFRGLEP